VTCSINQVETKIQKGLSELLLNREASYSRLACRSGCSVIASHKRRSVILTPLYPSSCAWLMMVEVLYNIHSPLFTVWTKNGTIRFNS